MLAPVEIMPRAEIIRAKRTKCVHGHTGLDHYSCYKKSRFPLERIGFFDIESTGLEGDWAFTVCFSIKELDGPIISHCITPKDVKDEVWDKRLLQKLALELRKFDRLVTYHGFFDNTFTRTRSVKFGIEEYPAWGEINHTDLYQIIKHKFNFSRRSMKNVCGFFGIDGKESPITRDAMFAVRAGHQWAIDYFLKHNIEDVKTTEELYKRIKKYQRQTNSSI